MTTTTNETAADRNATAAEVLDIFTGESGAERDMIAEVAETIRAIGTRIAIQNLRDFIDDGDDLELAETAAEIVEFLAG